MITTSVLWPLMAIFFLFFVLGCINFFVANTCAYVDGAPALMTDRSWFKNAYIVWYIICCTTPRKLVVHAPMGAQPLRSCVPLHGSRALSCHSQQWHDVTITALRLSVDLRDLLAHKKLFCE